MNKYFCILMFLVLLSSSGLCQDSTKIFILIKNTQNEDQAPNPKLMFSHNGNVFLDTVPNDDGALELRFSSDKFPKGALINMEIQYDNFFSNSAGINWRSNYDFYQEIYLKPTCLGGKEFNFDWMFLFKRNQYQLVDSLEQSNFGFLSKVMRENPTTIIQAKALYNFNESVSVARQRLDYFKFKLKDYKINTDRIVFKVMEEEYEQDYYNDSSEVYSTLSKTNYQNASREEKAVYTEKFQRIEITIVSWEYKPENHK